MTIEQVLKDIYKIEIPLPDNPLRALNAYLIKSETGRSLLIDTGFNRRACREAIESALKTLHVDMGSTDLFITHLHSDHCGLASVLPEKETRIYCSEKDGALINYATDPDYWSQLDELFIQYGFPRAQFGRNTDIHPGRKFSNTKIIDFTYLDERDVLTVGDYHFTCILTPGHTPGHMCLYDREKGVFFSGDHILGTITPNICIELQDENPLGQYIESLKRVDALDFDFVFSAHRALVDDGHKRIEELIQHHKHRMEEIISILGGDWMNAYQVAKQMSWRISCKDWDSFPPPQKWFATGEAISHLQYMYFEGHLEKETKDGIFCFKNKSL